MIHYVMKCENGVEYSELMIPGRGPIRSSGNPWTWDLGNGLTATHGPISGWNIYDSDGCVIGSDESAEAAWPMAIEKLQRQCEDMIKAIEALDRIFNSL